jgi:glycosyltransferase involved in cell wall biosynthesis
MNNLSKLKLCFLAGTLGQGGAERQLFYILQALRQAGAAVRLLSLDRGGFWEEKISALGIPVTWVGEHHARLKRLFRILQEVRKDPPDVLQSQHFYTNAYIGLAAKLSRASGIGAMRSNGRVEVSESGRVGGWLNLLCPAAIAANSQNAMRFAIACGVPASRLFFLPNVVDTDQFQPADGLSKEPFTLIAVGRLVTEKRFDRFIAILHRLRTNYHLNVRGLIVGAGCLDEDLRPELEYQARRLGLFPDAIQFCGGVADVRPLFREAAVCVLNSDYEGTPNVLLEAMACGLPVAASRVGGVPEIVRHGKTGFLFQPDDLEGFASALAELMKTPGLRAEMGQRARTFIEENHSLHRLPAYLENLYQPLLSAPRPATAKMIPDVSIGAGPQSARRA